MIKNLLTNWKTTSAGLAMIISSTVHLVISVSKGNADESTWTTGLMGIVGGVGLLAAGDGATTVQAHQETLNELENIKSAVRTGDTSILTKPAEPK